MSEWIAYTAHAETYSLIDDAHDTDRVDSRGVGIGEHRGVILKSEHSRDRIQG